MKRYSRRRAVPAGRPTRTWMNATTGFTLAGIANTGSSIVMQMQAPSDPTNLTADPPEDITILRIVAEFSVNLSSTAAQAWTLALLVQDVTWTPETSFLTDADKRMLWYQTYAGSGAAATSSWYPPGMYAEAGGQGFPGYKEMASLDISPKVRLEPGKALYLVGYERNLTAGTITVSAQTARILYQRSGRRK